MPTPRLALALAAVTLVAACDSEQVGPRPPIQVRTQMARIVDFVPTLSLTGDIEAQTQADISFRISGKVVERKVDVGEHVNVGDVLARLDPAQAQADLDSADASVTAAEAVLKQSQTAFDRQKALFDGGFATRTAYDNALQSLRTAQGSLDSAKALRGTAADALSFTELKADHAGIVTARTIEVGQVVQPAQAAYTIAVDGPRDAVFNVYESVILAPPTNDETKISLIANPSVVATGRLREISPTVDTKVGTVKVKIGLDDINPAMRLGAAVVGRAQMPPRPVVRLPWSAISTDDGAPAVWTVDPQNHAVSLRPIIPDSYENKELIVATGLIDGEEVVTEGTKFLFPGLVVSPLENTK